MDDGSIISLVVLFILLAMSAYFSAAETAFSCINRIRLMNRAEDGDPRAKRVLKLAEHFDSLLSTILIGNNIVNIAMASMATLLFTKWLGGSGPTVSTIVVTLVVLIFGEITPKSLAKEMPERIAIFSAPLLGFLMVICTPLNFLFGSLKKLISKLTKHSGEGDAITEEELVTMVSEAEKDGGLTDRESELIRSAIEFDDVEVAEVLTPRVDVVAVEDTEALEVVESLFLKNGYSRIPVYHDSIDNIIGIVHEKDLFAGLKRDKVTLSDLTAPAIYTTGSTKISSLLRTLREGRHHMAVVIDEYGGTEGIVTLEDILEELVGEIWDEHDEVEEEISRQTDGSWLISGDASVDSVCEELGIKTEEDAVSVSGLVQDCLGRIPHAGDRFEWQNYEVVVTNAAHRRVLEVRFKVLEEQQNKENKKETSK